jgi:hypothetical protein
MDSQPTKNSSGLAPEASMSTAEQAVMSDSPVLVISFSNTVETPVLSHDRTNEAIDLAMRLNGQVLKGRMMKRKDPKLEPRKPYKPCRTFWVALKKILELLPNKSQTNVKDPVILLQCISYCQNSRTI